MWQRARWLWVDGLVRGHGSEALLGGRGLDDVLRFTARARSDRSPDEVWRLIDEPRRWTRLLGQPGLEASVQRVKMVDGGQELAEGRVVQALAADLAWTTYEVTTWRPGKQLDLRAVAGGHGESEGAEVRPARAERVVIIPQGGGSEVECTVVLDVGGVGRLLGPMLVDRSGWKEEAARRAAWLAGSDPAL